MTNLFSESSADDLMRESIAKVLELGERIEPSRGPAIELPAVVLELTNPLARLSRSEGRGRVFSALGELCWYLSRTNRTDFIAYYLPAYRAEDEDGLVHGGYGPRLFSFGGVDQVAYVIQKLRNEPSSRRSVIQIFDRHDVVKPHKDVPCTCTLQFLVRSGKLQLITHMRSNDAYLGLPHDIFTFTMFQELVARSIDMPLGSYVHMVGSFHIYEERIDAARAYLGEGWQSNLAMPEMPAGDPWPSVERLLQVEMEIRTGVIDPMNVKLDDHPYWTDLARLLSIFALRRSDRVDEVTELQRGLNSRVFDVHIADQLVGG